MRPGPACEPPEDGSLALRGPEPNPEVRAAQGLEAKG